MIKGEHIPSDELNKFERFMKKSVWPGYLGFLWALMYAVFVRFYQAAGGSIGLPGQFEDPASGYMASYVAGVVIMACGFALLLLIKPWGKIVPYRVPIIGGRKIPRLLLLLPTLAGTAFLIAHGVSGIITKILHLLGIITIHFQGWSVVNAKSLVLWDLLFYEPWFLTMGILAGLTAFHFAHTSGIPVLVLRRGTKIFLTFLFLLILLFVYQIIFKL
ncbi:DUF3995 domain-containing protein [Heyndrickxia sp. NPDC080065]|uniref:DUF3995 domain-containing protein n=1 Tax=Heyndrickxia sp. NPDC080065 TaxID=3390568 RepID=UPI003D0880FC